jgi:phage-related minor tail protein
MSLGSLVLELQGNLAKTQEDMGRLNQIVESAMARIDQSAARTSRNIQNVATQGISRISGAQEAANDLDRVGHSATGVRRELLVLTHELATGNFRRAAGSSLVLAERWDLLSKLASPLGIGIGLVVGAFAGLAIAAAKGAEQSSAFAHSLQLTGNYAGLTEGRFNEMARTVQQSANVSIGSARDITQALISTGRFGGESLGHVATAASIFAEVSGQKAEEVVKNFERMSDGPLKFALEMDKQTHFMTGALFDQIKALEDSGQKEQAMITISDALVAAFKQQGYQVENTGLSWKGFTQWVSGAVQALEHALGGATTAEDRIASLKAELRDLQSARNNAPPGGGGIYDSRIDDVTRQLNGYNALARNRSDNADLVAAQKKHDEQVTEAKQYWDRLTEAHHEGAANLQRELDKIREQGTLAGASPGDIQKEQDRVRKEYADKGAGGVARADLSLDLQPLQAQISSEDRLLSERERVLSKYYKDGAISIQGYYGTEETVIKANIARVSSLYDQEIAVIENAAKRASDARTKTELTRQADQVRSEKQRALDDQDARLSENLERKTADTEAYRQEVERLNSELGKLEKNPGATAGADFDRQHAGLQRQASAAGDSGTLDTLAQARAAAVAQAQVNSLKAQAEQINAQLEVSEKLLAVEIQTGQKGEIQGEVELGKLRSQAAQQLAALQQQMQGIANSSGLPQIELQAQQFNLQVQQLDATSNVLGKSIGEVFQNSFARMLDNSITRTKSLKQEFLDMANSIEQAITQIISKDLANQLFGTGSNDSAGLIGQLAGLVSGFFGDTSGSENIGASATSTPDDLISGYRAYGGPVLAGGMYEVNERGPELLTVANRSFLMMGKDGGTVTPTGPSSGAFGGGHTFNNYITVPPGTSRQTANQQAAAIMRQARISMLRNS